MKPKWNNNKQKLKHFKLDIDLSLNQIIIIINNVYYHNIIIKYLHLEEPKTIYTTLFIIVMQQSISIKKEMSLFIQIIHMIMNILLRNQLRRRNTIKLFEEYIKDNYNNEFTIINELNEVMKNNTYFE